VNFKNFFKEFFSPFETTKAMSMNCLLSLAKYGHTSDTKIFIYLVKDVVAFSVSCELIFAMHEGASIK
jgi:hypothetical protein